MAPTWLSAALLALLAAGRSQAASPSPESHAAAVQSGTQWVDTWTAMPQLTEYANLPAPPYNGSGFVFPNTTIRQTLHMSIPADIIRIVVSNRFGNVSLPVTGMTVAYPVNGTLGGTLAGASAIDPGSLQTATFSGSPSINIPDGSLAVSDPLYFPVKAQSEVSVTMYLQEGQLSNMVSSHPGSRVDTYYQFGNALGAANIDAADVQSAQHWFFLSAVQAWAPAAACGFVVVGDSITDGRESDTDHNDRWPDLLLARMQKNAATKSIAVLNQAAGGNRILADGNGPAAVGRIERDVVAQPGTRYAMIFEGVNDIGVAAPDPQSQQAIGDQLIQAFRQIVTRTHAAGLPMFAATITPFGSPANTTVQPYSSAERDKTRVRINNWIRTSGVFEEVFDFDQVVRDPANPSQLNPKYNSGDYLHPNEAGYHAIANSVDLGVFAKWAGGVDPFQ